MSENYSQDIQDLWGLYQATKTQIQQVQTVKTQVLTALQAINGSPGSAGDDFKSYARNGEDGGEQWTRPSLLDRFDSLCAEENRLTEILVEQRRLAIAASPGFQMRPIGRGCRSW